MSVILCFHCKHYRDLGYILVCLAQNLEFWEVLANDSMCQLEEKEE